MKTLLKPLQNPEIATRLLDSFTRIAHVINVPDLDYNARLGQILGVLLDHLGVESGSIMVLERKKYLVVRAASRSQIIGLEQNTVDSPSVASWVARHREPVFVKDICQDPRFCDQRRDSYRTNSLLSVPILHKGTLLGVINVTDKIGTLDLLQEDATRLLDFSRVILSLLVQENLQVELRRQQRTLRKRNQELRRHEALQAELSRMLIHDLKGPLSEVVANLDILSYTVSEENRDFLESAQVSCDHAVRMVSNLVTIGKIEDGKLTPIKELTAPGSLMDESMSGIKGVAMIRGVALVIDENQDLPQIELDRTLILRVLQNLLTNAIGYSPSGTTIHLGCRKLPGKKQIEFSVRDEGTGIPVNRQKIIFEKYVSVRTSERRDLVGTGLGLYFCRLAVEVHRGKIGVESEPGKGSRFFFTLPL